MWTTKAEDHDVVYKVVLLGETFVGKTALLNFLQGEPPDRRPMPTIGFDYMTHIFDIEGVRVKLELWDTAGQERFRSLTRSYYKESNYIVRLSFASNTLLLPNRPRLYGAVLVYDVTDPQSLAAIQFWCDCIRLELGYDANSTATLPVVLLGNKADLQSQRRISTQRGEEEAAMQQVMEFFETSAVTGDNVGLSFQTLAKHLLETLHPKMLSVFSMADAGADSGWHEASFKVQNEEETPSGKTCPCQI